MDTFETIIVGGGPNGIALGLELEQRGQDYIICESREAGWTWGPKGMFQDTVWNPHAPNDPRAYSITDHPRYSFDYFWGLYGTNLQRGIKDAQYYTSRHFFRYLEWLRSKIRVKTNTRVESIDHHSGLFYVMTTNGLLYARNIVLATGLIGCGSKEFVFSPSKLRGRSRLVAHVPGDLLSHALIDSFIGNAKELTIIGGAAAFGFISNLTKQIPIHFVSPFEPKSAKTNEPWTEVEDKKNTRKVVVPKLYFERVMNDNRVIHYPYALLHSAKDLGDQLVLTFKSESNRFWEHRTPRLIEATGMVYDVRKIPLFKSLLSRMAVVQRGMSCYVEVGADKRVKFHHGHVPMYVMGEGAVGSLGNKQRWLTAVSDSVRIIAGQLTTESGSNRV